MNWVRNKSLKRENVSNQILHFTMSTMPTIDQHDKTIQLLDLLNEYQELTTIYRLHFINGFLNLSRANFQSEKTKFGKDTFDMRSYDACKVVGVIGDEFNVIDRRDAIVDCDFEDRNALELQQDTQLKNRKKNGKPTKTDNATNTYKDPILQFGALTPPQLKTSQEDFDRALKLSVQIINIRSKIATLTSELESI